MIEGVEKFKLDLKHFAEVVVPENHTDLCRRIALNLHANVTNGDPGNPKDTGWSRANWGVYIGREGVPTKPMGAYPESKAGQYAPMSTDTYFKPETILSIRELGKFPFIWVYNNVPYIEVLENGHSKQAPQGMLESALNETQTFMDTL